MGWMGTEIQLRRPDMEQMLEEHTRDPSALRRRGCVTCMTLVIVFIIVVLLSVLAGFT